MATTSHPTANRGHGSADLPQEIFGRLVGTIHTWRERIEQRRQLAELDERMLRDIGVSAADVVGEVDKPFWKA
ncbi:MAG: DUF1127 domain-containing protein [Azospirillaceae bacterium]|nr:DUF1127 domain-containing protein [Azospirillaceae bacterium]